MSEKVIYYFFTIFIMLGIVWAFDLSWIFYLTWFFASVILAMVWDDMWDDYDGI